MAAYKNGHDAKPAKSGSPNKAFDAWLLRYVGEQDARTMRFTARELKIAFDAGMRLSRG